jgi:hypothetical protein
MRVEKTRGTEYGLAPTRSHQQTGGCGQGRLDLMSRYQLVTNTKSAPTGLNKEVKCESKFLFYFEFPSPWLAVEETYLQGSDISLPRHI